MVLSVSLLAAGAIFAPLAEAALSALEVAVLQRKNNLLMARDEHILEKRVSTTFSLEQTLEDEVMFDGNSEPLSLIPFGVPPVTVVCAKCCTTGEIEASFTLEDLVKPNLRFDLRDISAFIELDVSANGAHTFTLPLFRSPPSPLGFSIPRGPSLGLTFEIDLIFTFSAEIDLNGGFFLTLPDDAFFEANLIDGALGDLGFDGITSQALPLTINNNGTSAKFQVDLQLRAQVGIDATSSLIPVFRGLGAQAIVGVFVNIVEFVAELTTTEDCQLQANEFFDLNVGAFLRADVQVGGKTIGAVPTISTTLFQQDVGTQCLVSAGLPFPTRSEPIVTAAAPECTPTLGLFGGNFTGSLPTGGVGTVTGLRTTLVPTVITTLVPSVRTTLFPKIYRRTNDTTAVSLLSAPPQSTPLGPGQTTEVLTITTCGAAVPNCPPEQQGVVELTRTICAAASSATTRPVRAAVCGVPPANATAIPKLPEPVTSTFDPAKVIPTPPPSNGTGPASLFGTTATATEVVTDAPLPTESGGSGAGRIDVPGTGGAGGDVLATAADQGVPPAGTPLGTPVGNGQATATAGAGRLGAVNALCVVGGAGLASLMVFAL